MQLSVGDNLGRYEIKAELGSGGMGTVYEAIDSTLQRKVAIKVLKPNALADSDGVERFNREAKAIAGLSHPNIISLYDFAEHDDAHYAVMEYADGTTLDECVESVNRDRAIEIAIGMANGLSAAHEGGIIHRDIKPSNVILTTSNKVKLLDFGLASVQAGMSFDEDTMTAGELKTQIGTVMGTAGYMSPEQVRGRKADERSDIFSFGVVLYELLQGRRAFKRDSVIETMSAILKDPLPGMEELSGSRDPVLMIAAKCLQKEPDDRYQRMSDVAEDLAGFIGATSSSSPSKTSPKLLVGIAAAVVIAALGLFLLTGESNDLGSNDHNLGLLNEDKKPGVEDTTDSKMTAALAISEELPRLILLSEQGRFDEGYRIAEAIKPFLEDNKSFQRAWEQVTMSYNISSIPDGATVSVREYVDDTSEFVELGKTPLVDVRLSRTPKVLTIEKDGYHREIMTSDDSSFSDTFDQIVTLAETGTIPDGMVRVYDGTAFPLEGMAFDLEIKDGFGVTVSEFYIDQYEVSNREFKEFIDDGGYSNPEYWIEPVVMDGESLSFEESRKLFVDSTGRAGPADWRVGQFDSGKGDYPVQGVSWYEARAYARWAGKDLPTLYHFSSAAAVIFRADGLKLMINRSNVNTGSYTANGETTGMSPNGIFDLCGNVSEWALNKSGSEYMSLGGSAEDPAYFFGRANPVNPLDRSSRRGFRCVKYLSQPTEDQLADVTLALRDYTDATPVADEIFDVYKSQFNYDDSPLNATMTSRDEESSDLYIKEIWEIDAAYNNERIIVYVHLPKNAKPPFQSLVYFHHAGSIVPTPIAESVLGADRYNFANQSGRAFIQPVLKGMYDRNDGLKTWSANDSQQYADFLVQWIKDYKRTIDYIVSREDMDAERIAHIGDSWGSFNWLIVGAVEPRVKIGLSFVGGLSMTPALPQVDQINYVTRVKQPTLHLVGAFDQIFPLERSTRPAFELLGTPDEDKKFVIYESGHTLPPNDLIRESLDFLDRYFGPTN